MVNLSKCIFVTKNIGWCRDYYLDSAKNLYSRIFKTTDGGYHWNLQKLVINEGAYGYFGVDSLYFWFLGALGRIFKTTDGGITWDSSTIGNKEKLEYANAIYFFDRWNGIAIGTSKWLTTDGGTVWTVIDSMGWFPPSDIDFSDRYHGWMTSVLNPRVWDRGSILNTKDGGYSWNYQGDTIGSSISTEEMEVIYCIDSNIVYAVGHSAWGDGAFYWTTDGGTNWIGDESYGGELYDVEFYNRDTGWISGCCGYIRQTTDGGNTWKLYSTNINTDFRKITVLQNENVVYVMGTNSALLRADIIADVQGIQQSKMYPFTLLQNYPNPFNSQTTINYSIDRPSNVELKIFNILGEEIETLIDQFQYPGIYSTSWTGKTKKGGELPSGIYFYRLISNSKIETKKMLILK